MSISSNADAQSTRGLPITRTRDQQIYRDRDVSHNVGKKTNYFFVRFLLKYCYNVAYYIDFLFL